MLALSMSCLVVLRQLKVKGDSERTILAARVTVHLCPDAETLVFICGSACLLCITTSPDESDWLAIQKAIQASGPYLR